MRRAVYNHTFWVNMYLQCGNWHFKSKWQWHLKTSVQKLWKGANCFVMHQISLCSIAHKRHLRSRRRMVYIMLPFSGGKGLGVVLCPFCILLPYSECPERMLSVSIFTQLCYRIFLWNWLTHNLTFRWVLGQDVTLLDKDWGQIRWFIDSDGTLSSWLWVM